MSISNQRHTNSVHDPDTCTRAGHYVWQTHWCGVCDRGPVNDPARAAAREKMDAAADLLAENVEEYCRHHDDRPALRQALDNLLVVIRMDEV